MNLKVVKETNVCFWWAAQISNKAGRFEEKDRKPHRQGVPRTRQEQPTNLQLLGIKINVSVFLFLEFSPSLYTGEKLGSLEGGHDVPILCLINVQ